MPNGYVIFNGLSELDGAPVIAVATGFATSSSNRKTGPGLVQTWILRADISPVQAVSTGEDRSICGPCPMRGTIEDGRVRGRTCYVTVVRAPLNIWRSYARSTEEAATRPQSNPSNPTWARAPPSPAMSLACGPPMPRSGAVFFFPLEPPPGHRRPRAGGASPGRLARRLTFPESRAILQASG
jgi:hypothetical protein